MLITQAKNKAIAALFVLLFAFAASGAGVASDLTIVDVPAVQIACAGGNGGGC